jgi:hypothetical protein
MLEESKSQKDEPVIRMPTLGDVGVSPVMKMYTAIQAPE